MIVAPDMKNRPITRRALAALACLATALFVAPVEATRAPQLESSLERAVLEEMNLMRANPRAYAKKLERMRPRYKGTLLMRGKGEAPILTTEGRPALEE